MEADRDRDHLQRQKDRQQRHMVGDGDPRVIAWPMKSEAATVNAHVAMTSKNKTERRGEERGGSSFNMEEQQRRW